MTGLFQLAVFLAGSSVLLAPGWMIGHRLFPGKPTCERWIWGATVGLAVLLVTSFGFAYLRLSLFLPIWIGVGVSGAIFYLASGWRPRLRMPTDAHTQAFVGLLLVVAAIRFGVALAHELPPGWDPAFHLILAGKIASTGAMISDWKPFEQIDLNYPVGSHILIVLLGWLTRLPLETVFKFLIPMLGILATAQIYLLASWTTHDRATALYSAMAYGLWALYGSIDYYRWGGLPNLLGMCFLVAALTLLADEVLTRRHSALLALLLAVIPLAHHHVMVTAAVVLLALLLHDLLGRRDLARPRCLLLGGLGASVVGSIYIIPYLFKSTTIGETSVLNYRGQEEFFGLLGIAFRIGYIFTLFSIVGVIAYAAGRKRFPTGWFLPVVSAPLAISFVAFGYGWQALSRSIWGVESVAFTPSRFLTDLVYFLSVFAGYALARLASRWGINPKACLVLGVLLVASNYQWFLGVVDYNPPAEFIEACRWIHGNTPPDTVVLNDEPWTTYLSGRRSLQTPIPISEPSTRGTRWRHVRDQFLDGRISPEIASAQVVEIRSTADALPGSSIMWRHSSENLVIVRVARGGFPPAAPTDPCMPD